MGGVRAEGFFLPCAVVVCCVLCCAVLCCCRYVWCTCALFSTRSTHSSHHAQQQQKNAQTKPTHPTNINTNKNYKYLDGPEVDVDVVMSDGVVSFGAITDNWPTVGGWWRGGEPCLCSETEGERGER